MMSNKSRAPRFADEGKVHRQLLAVDAALARVHVPKLARSARMRGADELVARFGVVLCEVADGTHRCRGIAASASAAR